MSDWNPANDAWLAGFTDGEGCFYFRLEHRGGRHKRCQPEFSIGLRADDLAALETLQRAFGGRLAYRELATPEVARNPQWVWHVYDQRGLAGLVRYFDRFPLRAKKARDYVIWRRAVLLYCAHGGKAPELLVLREELMKGRAYAADHEPAAVEPSAQLQLVVGGRSRGDGDV